ncbi:TPA: hypothetical protein ENX78_10695 [Candidatus Poribacteria bacterium]|nr:hypothetical protein [Candidatus Poribacteria bacterium]
MDLNQLLNELKKCKKNFDLLFKQLKEISYLEQDRMANLPRLKARLATVDKTMGQLIQCASQSEVLRNWASQYREDLVRSEEHFKKHFGVELERELRAHNLSLSGQYPDLKSDLYTIELDFDGERVVLWYGPKQERIGQCHLSVTEIVNRIEKFRQQIGSGLSEDEFLKRLREAYSRVMGINRGEPAPIIAVLTELAYLLQDSRFRQDPRKENYRSYSRADFSYDIYKFRQIKGLRLKVATRDHTKKRMDFLWVPDNESGEGTTYSHLYFEEKQE